MAFSDLPKYGGSFQDELDETIEAFETIADLCDVSTEQEKRIAIPIMLKGSAFRLYSRNKDQVDGYEKGISMLRQWYEYKEKQTRLLKEGNQMRLTEAMTEDNRNSELDVFKAFVDRSMALQ